MIEHIVILKFDPTTTEAQKDEVIQRLKALKDQIPGIIDMHAGYDFSKRNQGFQIGLTARFEDQAALEAYGPHPKHQEVVLFMREVGLVDIIVVDFEI